jgi:hypothetical protein
MLLKVLSYSAVGTFPLTRSYRRYLQSCKIHFNIIFQSMPWSPYLLRYSHSRLTRCEGITLQHFDTDSLLWMKVEVDGSLA